MSNGLAGRGLPLKRTSLLDELPDLTVAVERSSRRILHVGLRGLEAYGYEPHELVGHQLDRLTDLDLAWILGLATNRADRREAEVFSADGKSATCLLTTTVTSGDEVLISAQALDDLRRSRSRLSDLMHLARMTKDIFVVTDEVGTITYVNHATKIFHGAQEFVGRPVADFAEPASWDALMSRVFAGETSVETRILGVAKDGTLTPLSLRTEYDPDTQRWYTVERDISEQVAREEHEQRLMSDLRHQAMTDPLTGLANRAAFRSAVEVAIEEGLAFSVLMLDMDDFKSVNDTLGHSVGDQLLIEVATRIRGAVPTGDLVARLGGDEFTVLGFGVGSDDLASIAQRILGRVSQQFEVGGCLIQRSCSIGGAVWKQGESYSQVMLRADRAAYQAKHAGRSRYTITS